MAYEQLQKAKQLPSQSPTELLDYLRLIWEELGTEYNLQLQVLSYVAALRTEIREDVERLLISMREHLWQVEEQANISHRRLHHQRLNRDNQNKLKEQKRQGNHPKTEGNTKDPKGRKRGKLGQNGSLRNKKFGSGPKKKKIKCFNCREPGHYLNKCKNEKKPRLDPREEKTGKDKGQKN